MKNRTCVQCRKPLVSKPKRVRHCSYTCAWKSRATDYTGTGNPYHGKRHTPAIKRKMRGANHHLWKGGRIAHPEGYIYCLRRNHPRANRDGYVYEHILVVEAKLERHLLKGEVVHHINGIKSDNRPENLMTFPTNAKHITHHHRRP